jgi:endothelin-converting enzyme/putative endopeptidase
MKALQTILSENNVSAWKEYMKWTLLNGSTGFCLVQSMQLILILRKDINRRIKQRPLEDRALQTVNGTIGEALGKLYVEKCFLLRQKQKRKR